MARIALSLLIVLTWSITGGSDQADAQDSRPNILWISVEDMSPRLGAYGDPVARTPNIDRLAEQGVRYTNAFTTHGVCAPSRAAIITGMYQTSIGAHHMRVSHGAGGIDGYVTVPPPYVKTFTEYLRAAGYFCTNNVKTDYQIAPGDPSKPITAWDHSSRQAHWRDRPDPDQPFFSVFNHTGTHESQIWPSSNEGRPLETDLDDVVVPPYYPDTPVVRRDIAQQYDNIARMDSWVGDILQQLEDDGLADNTIVFFWSDHGDGLPRGKRWIYDSGISVPLIVRYPGQLTPGRVEDRLVSFVDLAPTVLSLAGVGVPEHMQGKAFLGPQEEEPREYIYAARDRLDESYDMVRAVRDERYKYIRNYYPLKPYVLWVPYRNRMPTMQELLQMDAAGTLVGPQKLWLRDQRPPEELYDIQADPWEVNNLADDPAYEETLARFSAELEEWRDETGDMGDIAEDQMVEDFWPGRVQPVTMTPLIIPNAPENVAASAADGRVVLTEPAEVALHGRTHGSSIAYTTDEGDDAHWLLYSGPIQLSPGETTIRARAIRYGYAESDEVSATIAVKPESGAP